MDETRWRNISRLRHDYDRGAPQAADGPIEAFFEISARCNLRCQMCAINYDSRYRPRAGRPPFFDPDLFERLRPIFPTLVRAYLFGLGEPTLNPHLVDYVRELSDHGVSVWFNTNATLIDENRATDLALAGTEAVTVSIDGATAESYERIRRGARFDSVLAGLRALQKAREKFGRPKVDLSFVAMAGNIAELPSLVDLCAEVGGTGIHVEPLYYQNQADLIDHYQRENLGVVGDAAVEEILLAARERSNTLGVSLKSRFLSGSGPADYVARARSLALDWRCSEPWSSIWVTTAGEIRTCCLNDTIFGNLWDEPFDAIWNGPRFSEFRKRHASTAPPESCSNCRRNGRVRQSPFFTSIYPVTYEPRIRPDQFANRSGHARVDYPTPNDTLTDPITIKGRVPACDATVTLMIDDDPLGKIGVEIPRNGSSFALTGAVPYLSEGAHLISFRDEEGERWGYRQFFLWRPDGDRLRVTRYVPLPAPLRRPIRRPRFRIDGQPWTAVEWQVFRSGGEILGLALVDVETLEPGDHLVEMIRHRRTILSQTFRKLRVAADSDRWVGSTSPRPTDQ